jgi:uncharacterized protein YjbJ (UPF0337 family)
MPNQDEVAGKFEQVKGKIKQGVARVTGNERLANEGADDQAAGEVREDVGTVKRKVGETVEKIGKQIKK